MPAKIKYCGLKSPADIHAAISNHAAYVGFVHHSASSRHLSIADMAALMPHVSGNVKTVLVCIDPDDALLAEIAAHIKPDFVQVHKLHDIGRIKAIKAASGAPVIAAVNVASAEDIAHARNLEPHCAHVLFDAARAGSGGVFDWQLLRAHGLQKPWFLAGGLNADNVADAIAQTDAPMLDVSSGIESAPGCKSPEKIAQFYQAVLNAHYG